MKFKRYFYTDEFGEVYYVTLPYEITHEDAMEQYRRFRGRL